MKDIAIGLTIVIASVAVLTCDGWLPSTAQAHDPSIAIDRLKPGELQAWFDGQTPAEKAEIRSKHTDADLLAWGINPNATTVSRCKPNPVNPSRRRMMVRGKFKLAKVTQNAGASGQQLMFSAVCNDGTPENDRFHRYTPTGTLEMYVDNPSALEQFKIGKEYYLDFTPCD